MGLFCCPLCGKKLVKQQGTLRCLNRHSFDIAAEGYTHLLPANRKHSAVPGDDKQMVAARRRFLEAGFYAPFANKLCELVGETVADIAHPVLLDAGCGEGYYTAQMAVENPQMRTAGFDISKFAVKAAAKKYPGIEFAVASIFHIPAPAESVDCVVDIFAPAVPEEFARVLKKGGRWIYAVPGARHLYGMKEVLYAQPYENEVKDTEYPGFRFEKRVSVQAEITLPDAESIEALFSMTPYYWNTPKEGAERLRALTTLKTEIAFDFLVYQRK
ncbi:putative RNA methyltransferase [Pygmaiobacter massiliensis]|uniref:putative RNA methyltransferase n=1 Tax=Pygmaiobacter massiliensis TaxID=1917873 RepID=UPI002A83C260|nr:methyltransferase domain-containing protein [Pygmaiobacter massiliensis]MDY4784339.1 methyltransferase domain-containing protein [Pygmaiobacter massiliensis]